MFGCEEFFSGKAWEADALCSIRGIILKFSYDDYSDLMEQGGLQSKTAISIMRRISKKLCLDMIDRKKLSDYKSFSDMGAIDDDLFLENKFDLNEDR